MTQSLQDAIRFFENFEIHYQDNKAYLTALARHLGEVSREERPALEKELSHANCYLENLITHHMGQVTIAMHLPVEDVTEDQQKLLEIFGSVDFHMPYRSNMH